MNKALKLLFVIFISCAIGVFIYWGGKRGVVLFNEAKEYGKSVLAKKANTANSKAEKKSQKNDEDPETPESKEYTFFETLSDPEMKKIVGLNHEIQEQPVTQPSHDVEKPAPSSQHPTPRKANTPPLDTHVEESTAVLVPDESKTPKKVEVARESEKKMPVATTSTGTPVKAGKTPVSAKKNADDDKTYTVQVNSFRDLSRAQRLQNQLQKKGYPAYLLSVETSKKGEVLYRVFLGKYIGQNNAIAAANKIKKDDKIDATVVQLGD